MLPCGPEQWWLYIEAVDRNTQAILAGHAVAQQHSGEAATTVNRAAPTLPIHFRAPSPSPRSVVNNPFIRTTNPVVPTPLPQVHSFFAVSHFQAALARSAWSAKDDPQNALAWCDRAGCMLDQFGAVHGRDLMLNLMHCFEKGPALSWFHSIYHSIHEEDWTFSLFKEKFLQRFAGQVRDEHSLALEKLVHHRISMGSDPIEVYAERFLAVSRLVPEISGAALCQHYIAGLHDALKPRCVLTMMNTEWTDITPLMNHSFAESLHLHLITSSGYPEPSPSRQSFPPPSLMDATLPS